VSAPAATPVAAPAPGASKPPASAEQAFGQGVTFAAMRDYDNAIKEFSRAIEISPTYAAAYANRGVAYMQQKKLNKALDDLTKATELDPKDKMAYYNLTALYAVGGQSDRAFDALDRALALGFDQYDALRTDPDLRSIRNHPDFRKVLEKHKVFLR
jgi:Flp pilus assembly protein TadD